MPSVSVSLITYTALACAKRCIASIQQHSSDYELILTANGNPAVALYFQRLAEQHANIRVVVNETNEGYQNPNRRALEMSNSPLHVLINDDTLVCPRWLEMLRKPFQDFPLAALSGPRARCTSLTEQFRGVPGYQLEYLEGSCLMGRTSLLREHGLFDPNLQFAYGEDSDLSLRMRQAGYSIHQVPFRLPFHAGGATTRTVPNLKPIILANHQYLMNKWADYLKSDRRFPHEA